MPWQSLLADPCEDAGIIAHGSVPVALPGRCANIIGSRPRQVEYERFPVREPDKARGLTVRLQFFPNRVRVLRVAASPGAHWQLRPLAHLTGCAR